MLEFLLIILFSTLGVLTGIFTGILPGLHVNNIALILLSLTGTIISSFTFLFGYGISQDFILILISVYIISTAISHTFHDTIPSTFLGAPDEDKALSVLPAHALLLDGKGYEAVYLSAIGSYGAIIFCFLLIIPMRLILGSPLFFYCSLKEIMVFVIIAICIIMIATEKSKIDDFTTKGKKPAIIGIFFALFVFILSGIFGIIIFKIPVYSPIGLLSPVLFPALSGLFATPTLLKSIMTKPKIPTQKINDPVLDTKTKKSSIFSIATGSITGVFVSIIPGMTSATGTVIAMNARGESSKRQTLLTLSAVNTACAFFVVVILFITLKARSGATIAIKDLVTISEWNMIFMPTTLAYFLIALLFGGTLSLFLTLKIGKIFAKSFVNISYPLIIKFTLILILSLVFLFTGLFGLLILFIATFIGLLPVEWGVRRSHCMGVLLIPIIIYFI